MFSRADSKRHGRHRTLVADLADDISHVCNFVSQDTSLPHIIGVQSWHATSWWEGMCYYLPRPWMFQVPSCTFPQRGTGNTSANALSHALGRSRADFDFNTIRQHEFGYVMCQAEISDTTELWQDFKWKQIWIALYVENVTCFCDSWPTRWAFCGPVYPNSWVKQYFTMDFQNMSMEHCGQSGLVKTVWWWCLINVKKLHVNGNSIELHIETKII